jgi:aminoglycoside phosphotransferase (APT) family kinase protein
MSVGTKPGAEIAIDALLVGALLREQHPDLATLPLIDVAEGWDNRLFRLADHLVVRLPRRALAARSIDHEQRWVPRLSARLPLPVPALQRVGHPGCGFPWRWSVTSWLPGEPALRTPPRDLVATAAALGGFLRALHQPAPTDAPHNPWRGVPLAARTPLLYEHLKRLAGLVDDRAVLDLWARVLSSPPWAGPPMWIHGDLHPGNLLVSEGRLSAVVDFGDLAAGDPATDLAVMWMLLPPSIRPAFLAAAGGFEQHDGTVMRARGWALALGLAIMANSADDPEMRALGQLTLDAALETS